MRTKFTKHCIFILAIFIFSTTAFSQVVNIEKKRKGNKDGFAGMVSAGFFLIDNGKNITQFKNSIDLQYSKGASTFILLNDFSLMTVNEDQLINSGFQHLRYNYTVKDSSFLTFELFGQHQYNSIKLLERRFLLGAGPRFRLVDSEKVTFYIATTAMYEYEQRSDSLKTLKEYGRLASYASLSWEIAKNLDLRSINYYQPAFTDFDNYRVASETSLNLKISDKLSFKVGIQTTYDSRPPEGVQELFYNWENSLKYVF